MSQRQKYQEPPIEEALCEFRFKSSRAWDFTVPGRLYDKLEHEYPVTRDQKAVAIGLDIQEAGPSSMEYNQGVARVQLLSKNGRRMIGVGPDTLAIHMLNPYQDPNSEASGWEDFKVRISAALGACWDITDPEGVCRVGIRYINKIIISEKSANVKEYFQVPLPHLNGLPEKLTRFVNQIEYDYHDQVCLILSQGYTGISQEGNGELILDLDVIWNPPEPVPKDKALEMVEDLHTREVKAFEAIITDKTRELFHD